MKCEDCSSLQLGELIPLDILYQSNHNMGIVGKTWAQHFEELGSFIIDNTKCDQVLEIGDPSCKAAFACDKKTDFREWVIIEPNPDTSITPPSQVRYESVWFDDYIEKDKTYDTIVLSHVFEHLYHPQKTLKQIRKLLSTDGRLVISIPDMRYLLENKSLPPAGLHFEHTYYVDLEVIESMLFEAGFKIEEQKNFNNHSLFISCSKSSISGVSKRDNNYGVKICQDVVEILDTLSLTAKDINNRVSTIREPVYLYGAHFPAQLLLSLGLEESNIEGILDNSNDKIGKKLYGTNLQVYSPKILENQQAYVICYMGSYTKEIKDDILKNINDEVIFI